MKILRVALLALFVCHVALGQCGWSYAPGVTCAATWREPVAEAADLPLSDNRLGDVRIVHDTGDLVRWDGFAWVATGGQPPVVVGLADLAACTGPGEIVEYGAGGVAACISTPSGGGGVTPLTWVSAGALPAGYVALSPVEYAITVDEIRVRGVALHLAGDLPVSDFGSAAVLFTLPAGNCPGFDTGRVAIGVDIANMPQTVGLMLEADCEFRAVPISGPSRLFELQSNYLR